MDTAKAQNNMEADTKVRARMLQLVFGGIFCLLGNLLQANDCSLTPSVLVTDEETDLVLCTEQAYDKLQFKPGKRAELVYTQALKRCAVNDRRHGFHVVLKGTRPGSTKFSVEDSDGHLLCQSKLRIRRARALAELEWLNSMPASEAEYVDVEGIRTRYFDEGTGRAIVLVHGGQAGGANNSAQKWEQNFHKLAKSFRVIALDRLAQAGTDNLPSPEDYADYFALDAKHLENFIEILGLSDVTLVGHSQGGWPVTRVALDRPDLVSCVVNVDTVMVPDDPTLMREALSFLMYTARIVDPPTGPTVHSARRSMALRYPSGNNITREKAQRVVDQYQLPKTAEAREAMKALRMTPLHPSFKALKKQAYAEIATNALRVPSVVIWGELDPQVPLGLGKQFNDVLLDNGVSSNFVIIQGAGHAPFIEFPRAFNRLVVKSCQLE